MTINDLSLVVIILNRKRFPGSDRITNKSSGMGVEEKVLILIV